MRIVPELPEVSRGPERVPLDEEAVHAGGLPDCGQVKTTLPTVGIGITDAVVTAAADATRLAGVALAAVEDVRGSRCNVAIYDTCGIVKGFMIFVSG